MRTQKLHLLLLYFAVGTAGCFAEGYGNRGDVPDGGDAAVFSNDADLGGQGGSSDSGAGDSGSALDAGGGDGGIGGDAGAVVDSCPENEDKTEPGVCGCTVSDVDSDSDGTPDCNDQCPNSAGKAAPGVCGCEQPDVDTDGDGVLDCVDGCPDDPNRVEPGGCNCDPGDADTDGDGSPDCNDPCPNDAAKLLPGQCGCGMADRDSDGDGSADCNDLCPNDAAKVLPGQCDCGTADTDTDGDGTPDCDDLCPNDADKTDPGECGCGTPDDDTDGDGFLDCSEECPLDPNKSVPGTCDCGYPDVDSDGDSVLDCDDACPDNPAISVSNPCGCDAACNPVDSDGDGVLDSVEDECGSDPLDPTDFPNDADGDGVCDGLDRCLGNDEMGDVDPSDGVCDDWAASWLTEQAPYRAGAAASAVLSDGLHYLGGDPTFSGIGTTLREHWVYTTESGWSRLVDADIPDDETWSARAVAYQDELYLVGGYEDASNNGTFLRKYSPVSGTWEYLNPVPEDFGHGFSYGAVHAVIGDSLYLFGIPNGSHREASGARYDFLTGEWDVLNDIPSNEGSGGLAGAAVGTRLYVINGGNSRKETLLQIFDTEAGRVGRWTTGPSLPSIGYQAAAAIAIGTKVYFFGGAVKQESLSPELTTTVNVFDTVTHEWQRLPPMSEPAMWSTAQVYDGKIHVLGGFDAQLEGIETHQILDL